MTLNIAHRGASGYYPENTLIAFEKAIELGCHGIETDVQMTKDGVLVLIHDELVNRTTNGSGLVSDYTYSELSKLDAGCFFGEDFKNEKIPRLDELLDITKNTSLVLNLELKNSVINYPNMEEKVIDVLYEYGLEDQTIISSFNHYSIKKCKSISQKIKTGILYSSVLFEVEKYAENLCADFIHPNFYTLLNNKHLIDNVKTSGLNINTYTVNEENFMKIMLDMNVYGIINNYPDKLKKLLV